MLQRIAAGTVEDQQPGDYHRLYDSGEPGLSGAGLALVRGNMLFYQATSGKTVFPANPMPFGYTDGFA